LNANHDVIIVLFFIYCRFPVGVAIDKGLGGVITSPTLLRPVLTWSQHNYQRFLKNVRYFETEGCCPSTLLRGKASMKKNEFTFSIQNDNEK